MDDNMEAEENEEPGQHDNERANRLDLILAYMMEMC